MVPQYITFIRDIALALCLAICVPWATYNACEIFYTYPPAPAYDEHNKPIDDDKQVIREHMGNMRFIANVAVGLICIALSTCVATPNLALGLLGGGILSTWIAASIYHINPAYRFFILILLLITLMSVIVRNKRSDSHSQ